MNQPLPPHHFPEFQWSPSYITSLGVSSRRGLVQAQTDALDPAYLTALRRLPVDDLMREELDFIRDADTDTHTNPHLRQSEADINSVAASRFSQDNTHVNAHVNTNDFTNSPAPSSSYSLGVPRTPTYTDMSLEKGAGQQPASVRRIVNAWDDHARDPLAPVHRKTRRSNRKQPREPDSVLDVAYPHQHHQHQSQAQPQHQHQHQPHHQSYHQPAPLPRQTEHQSAVGPSSGAPQTPPPSHPPHQRQAASNRSPNNTYITNPSPPSPSSWESWEDLNKQYDKAMAEWVEHGEERLRLDCRMKDLQRRMHRCADRLRNSSPSA